jgi:exodeoxyribonuclease VII large subunit
MHLARAMHSQLARDHVAFIRVARRLGDPRLAISAHQQTLDDMAARIATRMRSTAQRKRETLARLQQRLAYLHPRAVVAREGAELSRANDRLRSAWATTHERRVSLLQRATVRLHALSPLSVLARGYAIATREDGRAVRSSDDVRAGDGIHLRVHEARIDAQVLGVEPLVAPR